MNTSDQSKCFGFAAGFKLVKRFHISHTTSIGAPKKLRKLRSWADLLRVGSFKVSMAIWAIAEYSILLDSHQSPRCTAAAVRARKTGSNTEVVHHTYIERSGTVNGCWCCWRRVLLRLLLLLHCYFGLTVSWELWVFSWLMQKEESFLFNGTSRFEAMPRFHWSVLNV
jgi:hypothetical protein